MNVILKTFSKHRSITLKSIIDSLSTHDIQVEVVDQVRETQYGIVLFDQADQEICEYIRQMNGYKCNHIIAVSLQSSDLNLQDKWSLLQFGASDVFECGQNKNYLEMIAARIKRWSKVDEIVDSPMVSDRLVGRSLAWMSVLHQIVEIALFTTDSVLLIGESGTGKELFARLIHKLHQRNKESRLVLLDCSTIIPELSGSEFFGHERGAYTGAFSSRDGAFALADGGTLFLDEVGELPIRLQTELLRVIQEKTYKRLGSNTWKKTNFRLVCATNRNLEKEKNSGNFRPDLYYRLATWTFQLPSVRERREDILLLARHFLKQLYVGKDTPELDSAIQEYLLSRQYPGNVRDLRQLIERLAARHVGPGPITIGVIPEGERGSKLFATELWPDQQFESTIHCALLRGKGINEICDAARETAYNIVVKEEKDDTARSSRRLKISKRAVQMYLKNNRRCVHD